MKTLFGLLTIAFIVVSCNKDDESQDQKVIVSDTTYKSTYEYEDSIRQVKDSVFKAQLLEINPESNNTECKDAYSYLLSQDPSFVISKFPCLKTRFDKFKLLRYLYAIFEFQQSKQLKQYSFLPHSVLFDIIKTVYTDDFLVEDISNTKEEIDSVFMSINANNIIKSAQFQHTLKDFLWLQYYRTEIKKVNPNVLIVNNNVSGMAAGSRYFYYYYSDGKYNRITFDDITNEIKNRLSIQTQKSLYCDLNRFDVDFRWMPQSKSYEVEMVVQDHEGASCCPPFIVRFNTNNFKTILSSSLKYTNSDYKEKPKNKVTWTKVE